MLARICILLFCCLPFLSFAQQTASSFVDFKNTLSNCVSIDTSDTYDRNNLTLVDMKLTLEKNIGSCGCKSAIASITLENMPSGSSSFDFALIKSRIISVPLLLDNTLKNVSSIRGTLACGNN
ncbi:DUF2195 family protein [Vibrio campbellii]|nr:DUF2195 family protein [Vibrio campbellii]APX05963.1 DUF2195 domain-containing protein [Vibrio campbellii]AUW04764.1 DUF2195 domain-containing protein [Vibrio campbellii]AYO09649.1 DUF2195 family protein [Vibrio campbellii]HDM8217862.1 DUF2195 family protein [Vibrio campbellii]